MDVAVVDLWKPEHNPEDYDAHEVKGITLYVPGKMAKESDEVEISLAQMFRWKKLVLDRY